MKNTKKYPGEKSPQFKKYVLINKNKQKTITESR
jgi:hypothetical protein